MDRAERQSYRNLPIFYVSSLWPRTCDLISISGVLSAADCIASNNITPGQALDTLAHFRHFSSL